MLVFLRHLDSNYNRSKKGAEGVLVDRKMVYLVGRLILISAFTFIFLSFSTIMILSKNKAEKEQGVAHASSGIQTITPTHLGNGVYCFKSPDVEERNGFIGPIAEAWQKSLVKFIGDHPELRIAAIYNGDQNSSRWGHPLSILVVTEPREQSPEKEK